MVVLYEMGLILEKDLSFEFVVGLVELQMGFHDVLFLFSRGSFYTLLKNYCRGRCKFF